MSAIAIIGMACRYAEARSPRRLWENVLAQRRSFRRIPAVRLRLDDYSRAGQVDDQIYLRMAAVLEDYEFDRVRFQVSKEAFASVDMAHWLALDVARQALEDARLLDASNNLRERIGVYVGNSLTGEFSRANLLRLRWPYVRRALAAVLHKKSPYQNGDLHRLLDEVETLYKAPFPTTTEESLAGGLSNTIAGRICNYFNLKGGGYTVDGACASSLLAITTACSALESGDVDVAIAGGVDLSLDPFELAGFSKLGALAHEQMRVFDARSAGFWPGEGCGMVVLMRHEEAVAQQHSSYAVLRGWGVSSDGSGGITRPEVAGQVLALRRAYHRANYGIDSVNYFEGHGTGTSVGDAAELQALSLARREAQAKSIPAALGSIKANIGHTKAAAGVAGLIKATMAVQSKILPPTSGCETPHPELTAEQPMLRVLRDGELWPADAPVRAGVSAMGFGGINTHVTVEAVDTLRRKSLTGFERQQLASVQDGELFLFQAVDTGELAGRLREALALANEISFAEMADLAAALSQSVSPGRVRAACVASHPEELVRNLEKLLAWSEVRTTGIDGPQGIFLGNAEREPRIGFLFTGQGSPVYTCGGIWSRRFPRIQDLYQQANLPKAASVATEIAQPSVATASLAGLHALERCGVEATLALGHSLGEITALCWAGAFKPDDLLRIVGERGRTMARMAASSGSMASIRADWPEVKRRINGDGLTIAAYNSREQTVVAGHSHAVEKFAARLNSAGVSATLLPVSHAFHSPLVADVAESFHQYLSREPFSELHRRVVSTVTGTIVEKDADLCELLTNQITMPVRFADAMAVAAQEIDLFIEVGPGAVLSGIAAECTEKPVIALNSGSESLRGLLLAVGAAFASGANIRPTALFENRFVRPMDLKRRHTFLQNPCETLFDSLPAPPTQILPTSAPAHTEPSGDGTDALDVLRNLIAQRTELPVATIRAESRFLDDLHLNSITVSQIILQAAAQLSLPVPTAPTEYANATIAQAAKALEGMRQQSSSRTIEKFLRGVDSWIRALEIEFVEQASRAPSSLPSGPWEVLSIQECPLQIALHREFKNTPGSGVVCIVPQNQNEQTAAFLLNCAQKALQQTAPQVVFAGSAAAALARTLFLEHPKLKVTVVDVPQEHPKAAAWVAQEAGCASGFTEAHYDAAGIRREPRLKVLWPDENISEAILRAQDVLLITGGGKGIAAECALALARDAKCSLALVGRSDPAHDQQLSKNLQRFADAGIHFRYFVADVADAEAIGKTISQIETAMGDVTAVLHSAGINAPQRLDAITPAELHETLAPKLTGLENILSAVNPEKLRLLVTFGSIIARTGLHGEAHYGLANDWMSKAVQRWQTQHPACRCLNLEWSVWAGAGMGQHLGVLDSLVRQGIAPLPLDDAIEALKRMLAWKQAPTSSILTSRFGNLPTLKFPEEEIPLRRFLERIEVHYPGIELVADAELSSDTDPYVAEHVFQGEQLLPAVCGMEAMAQAAIVLENSEAGDALQFQHLRFEHPIVIPPRKPVTIRIAALRRRPGIVSVAIRCSSTSFQVDHFSAECVFQFGQKVPDATIFPAGNSQNILPLHPERDLYGRILFHHGRFRRIQNYRELQADRSVAEIGPAEGSSWYARHLPADFIAGHPAARDAALHSIQACIPHKTILPVGVDRIIATANWTYGHAIIKAIERVRDGDNFLYDVEIQDANGQTCEFWEGLRLQAVAPTKIDSSWPAALLAPYLERKLSELFADSGLRVSFGRACRNDQHRMDAVHKMVSPGAELIHRPDGKPELVGCKDVEISFSYAGLLRLALSGKDSLGCDLEQVSSREEPIWEKLLGPDAFELAKLVAERSRLPWNIAATRAWTLKEGLRKAGASFVPQLRLTGVTSENWAMFDGDGFSAATFHAAIEDFEAPFAFAFVIRKTQ